MQVPADEDLQIHKFLKDADEMLGTISNLELARADTEKTDVSIPQLGTVREMATRLREKLVRLTE